MACFGDDIVAFLRKRPGRRSWADIHRYHLLHSGFGDRCRGGQLLCCHTPLVLLKKSTEPWWEALVRFHEVQYHELQLALALTSLRP